MQSHLKNSNIFSPNIALKSSVFKNKRSGTKIMLFDIIKILLKMSNIRHWFTKILHKVFSLLPTIKFLEGLVGFGNLRLRRSKVISPACLTSELSEAGFPSSIFFGSIFPNFHKFGTVLRVSFFAGLDELTASVIAMNRFYTCKAISGLDGGRGGGYQKVLKG